MSYVKNTWVDQDVERPKTYEVTNNQDGSITLTDSFGLITELGTPVNETNMNHIEEGIEGCAIRKHNLTETFDLGEWVLGVVNNEKGIYNSRVDNNIGHSLEDTDYWEKVSLGGGYEVGDVIWRPLPSQDAGKHLLDGTRLSGDGIYKSFVDYIADLYADNPTANYFTDETTWQQSIIDYGVCGKFVYDDVNNTVRLPKITGIVEGTIDASALGDLVEAGLPNITGDKIGRIIADTVAWSGAFSSTLIGSNANVAGGSGTLVNNEPHFDASLSDSTYGNLATGAKNKVQPQTIKGYMYIVVANSVKTQVEIDIDEIATDLNDKADVDLSNISASRLAKNEITSWGVPDYDNPTQTSFAINTVYQAPCDGLVMCPMFTSTSAGYCLLNISKDNVNWKIYEDLGTNCIFNKQAIIPKGYYYKFTGNTSNVTIHASNTRGFYPLKGAQ